jgi:hypothetical protein
MASNSAEESSLIVRAESGDVDAMFKLGEFYHNEREVDGKRRRKACEWFARAMTHIGIDEARTKLRAIGINKHTKSTLCHYAAWFGFAELVEILIADVHARNHRNQTPFHYSAVSGYDAVVKMLIAAGADLEVTDQDGTKPVHYAASQGFPTTIKVLVAAGADLQATDQHGRTPLHYAASNGHAKTAEALLAAGADQLAAENGGQTAQGLAKDDQTRSILNDAAKGNASVVAGAFDAARSALDAARAVRGRLDALDAISPLITESTRAEGSFGTIAAICARAAEFADAERAFTAQQDILRAAEQLDDQVIAARDAARQQLVRIAAAVLEVHDAAPFGSLAAAGNRVASVKASLVGVQTRDDNNEFVFDEWLISAHKTAAFASTLTERGAEALTTAVQSLAAGGSDACGRHVVSALARVRFAAEQEKCALDDLRIPRTAHAKLVVKLDELRARVVQLRSTWRIARARCALSRRRAVNACRRRFPVPLKSKWRSISRL